MAGPVSARAAALTGSRLAHLLRVARSRRAVDLAIGAPGYPLPPKLLVDQACLALQQGTHHQYEDPAGEIAVRDRIARTLATPADPETEITITVGATEALHVALMSVLDPGDEVIVFDPCYEHFLGAITLTGARPRFVGLRAPDWRYDPAELAAAFGPRTRAVLLNNPHNPTGRVFTLDELNEIAELCDKWDVAMVSDEVYSTYVFDGRVHISVADMPRLRDRAIVVGSLSKSHAIPGWRVGFLRAEPQRTAIMRRVHEVTTAGTTAPLQTAVATSLDSRGVWNPAPVLQQRRDQAATIFGALGVRCARAEGGCFLYGDIGAGEDSDAFVANLLAEAGVLVAPGTLFAADRADGRRFVRIAFNRSAETLDAAQRNLIAATAPA
jgi:aminotransferase